MSDSVTHKDYVMPCLMDRLVDDAPHIRTGDRKDIFTQNYLRRAILRDLAWLLNAKSKLATDDIALYDEVESSTLNYGIEDICGRSYDINNLKSLEESVKKSLYKYEPRLSREDLEVTIKSSESDHSFSSFDVMIRGTIVATPVPEELVIHSLVDLETGRFELWS